MSASKGILEGLQMQKNNQECDISPAKGSVNLSNNINTDTNDNLSDSKCDNSCDKTNDKKRDKKSDIKSDILSDIDFNALKPKKQPKYIDSHERRTLYYSNINSAFIEFMNDEFSQDYSSTVNKAMDLYREFIKKTDEKTYKKFVKLCEK